MTDEIDPSVEDSEFEALRLALPDDPPRRSRSRLSTPWNRIVGWSVMAVLAWLTVLAALSASRGVVQALAVLLAFATALAIALLPGGALEIVRRLRFSAGRRRSPDTPWTWDHPWDPTGVSVTPLQRFVAGRHPTNFSAKLSVVIVLVGTGLIVAISVKVGDPISQLSFAGMVLAAWAWSAWRAHGTGTARVSYAKFPFHPGERVVLYFGTSADGASFERVAFHLRRISERPWRPLQPIPVTTFQRRDHRPPGLLPGPDTDVELAFDVPADAGGTDLASPYPEYWVLDVAAATSAGPYTESFLVPIYENPAAPPAAT